MLSGGIGFHLGCGIKDLKPLLDFFGKWPGDKKELDAIKKTLARDRKSFNTKEVSFN